ncbi:hypothetical protein [Sphingomonas asaccharolytica]|uniref:hypothetical protein n=1 Tax=Sphingomonas asaccharolytica TaxID=40681 RepID=UPI000A079E66|nr:hypothetical protein [Sphingomonas asaccharolytica]
MSEPKPFASLSSGLLARKGQARPAMRPQGFTGGYASLAGIEDLGWNDMGHIPEPMADIHPLHEDDQIQPPPEGVPPVLAQRHALKQEFEPPVLDEAVEDEPEGLVEAPAPQLEVVVKTVAADTFEPRPVSVAAAGRIARATQHKSKAAFTLRLDEERHLRLRLASAVSGRSAQQIVTGALDAFLESLPEVGELARQLPTRVKG